ncbi:MAG TPA: hypothetical protein VNJ47_03765 [Nevskiales bacterium]|nr:hypothetical protein [Nevskiales bacterium]
MAAPAAAAGDLETLPATERGFQDKVQAIIEPGHRIDDALRILEAHRFECREFANKVPVIHCARLDEPRYYQVMIEPTRRGTVGAVTPSLGIIRR